MASVASLWIGDTLSWLERLCLKSFVDKGQAITLYSYDPIKNVPTGVIVADANAIWTPPEGLLEKTAPSYLADLFRLHLMIKSASIWVDTDILCLKPIQPTREGYAMGWTHQNGEVNNAVLRLPRNSEILKCLIEFTQDLSKQPVWLRPALRQRVERLPVEDRLVGRFAAKRTVIGPAALTHFARSTGEAAHAFNPDVLFPVPWQFVDVLFNPFGGVDGWLSDDTCAVHLWSHMLKRHKRSHIHPDCFVGRALSQHEIEQN